MDKLRLHKWEKEHNNFVISKGLNKGIYYNYSGSTIKVSPKNLELNAYLDTGEPIIEYFWSCYSSELSIILDHSNYGTSWALNKDELKS